MMVCQELGQCNRNVGKEELDVKDLHKMLTDSSLNSNMDNADKINKRRGQVLFDDPHTKPLIRWFLQLGSLGLSSQNTEF